MSIKSILTPIDGNAASDEVARAAFFIGSYIGAHVDVLHVQSDPKDSIPLLGEGMSVSMIEEMIDVAEANSTRRRDNAKSTFQKYVEQFNSVITDTPPNSGMTASWSEEVGGEDEVLAKRGRLSDLSVVSQPSDDSHVYTTLTLNAALFETGRPVLVVPTAGFEHIGKTIGISWNGSAQSARAVSSALPLIKKAKRVIVFTSENENTHGERAQELVSYLRWHQIEAENRVLEVISESIGRNLLLEAGAVGVDLLVMGAYTHSRIGQLIWGGVTRTVLEESTIPLFMAH